MAENKRIFLASPHMSDEGFEKQYINDAFEKNWIAPLGENVNELEKAVKQRTLASETLALSSGTAAIHLALIGLGVGSGDIVFCQSLTFSASANPVRYVNAEPVFIDSDDSWNMSPYALRRAFEKYKDHLPKAVIVVHLYGLAANIIEIRNICNEYGVPLVEDAAESLGTVIDGKATGTFGKYGILSFNGNKIVTTSGGGMLLINGDDAPARWEKALFLATQAREPARHYEHREIGYNYRMSNICAGIGRGQMRVLDKRIAKKRYIYEYYKKAFAGCTDIQMMPRDMYDSYSNCWLSEIQLDGGAAVRPLDIMVALENENIESRPVWKPMHMQPVFAGCGYIDNGGTAQRLFENGVCLPSDTKMTDIELKRVTDLILELWK